MFYLKFLDYVYDNISPLLCIILFFIPWIILGILVFLVHEIISPYRGDTWSNIFKWIKGE
jgi:hypothetical protein